MRPPGGRRGDWLLGAGALLGAVIAAAGLIAPRSGSPMGAVAATVNGAPISQGELEGAVAAVAAERRAPVDERGRAQLLERLIDEELLVQRGLELGLAERDPRVRADLAGAVVGLLVSEGEAELQGEDEGALRRFFAEHGERFQAPPRLAVQEAWFGGPAALARAQAARARLDGGVSFAEILRGADPPAQPLPVGLLPGTLLEAQLGGAAAAEVAALTEGAVSQPLAAPLGFRLVQVVERQGPSLPPFVEVVERVRQERRRFAGEAHLRRFLDERRRSARIERRIGP